MPLGPRIVTTSPLFNAQADPAEHRPHTIMLGHIDKLDHVDIFSKFGPSQCLRYLSSQARTSCHHTTRFWAWAIQWPSSGNQT